MFKHNKTWQPIQALYQSTFCAPLHILRLKLHETKSAYSKHIQYTVLQTI